MSIIDDLITDRTESDVNRVHELARKWVDGEWTGTTSELSEWYSGMKGAYNATDLNRVNAAMEYLDTRLKAMGYTGGYYQRVKVPHQQSGGGSVLPEGYTQVEYIKSSGTQYVDTGVSANQNIGFEIDFATDNAVSTSGYGTIFGALESASNRFALSTYPDAQHGGFGYGASMYDPYITTGQRMTLSLLDGKLTTPNGEQTIPDQTFSINTSIAVFGRKDVSGGVVELSSDTIYRLKFYGAGTLIRDYIPCIDPSGEVGLYDTVDGLFYGNEGAGSFLAGPVVYAQLPEGYTPLKYIEADGTQYIDTGFKPNQDTRVVMDFELLSVTGQYADPIFGVRTSASAAGYYFWASGTAVATEQYQSGYNNGSTYPAVTRVGRHTVDKNKNVTTVDGVTTEATYAAFTTAWNMLLVQSYNNGNLYSQTTHMRLYSCQVYDNGAIARIYIPCEAPGGDIGLYDLVTKEFYGNAGTSAFIAGPEVEAPDTPDAPGEELDPYTWYVSDIPTPEALEAYLDNVRRFRSAKPLFATTPQVPDDMELATIDEWNDIEQILVDIEISLISIAKAAIYAGTPYIFAGGPMIYATGG